MSIATKVKLQNFIDGKFVDAADGATEEVTNPANGEVIAEMPLSTEEDVNRAVAAAKKAFQGWAATTPGERAAALFKLADALEEHAEEISDLEAADAGKPRNAFLEDEVPFTCDNLRFFGGAGRVLEGKAAMEFVAGRTSIIRREPVGVVGQIAPWNYPLMMAAWKIGPALATGNTIVLKPAETTPVSTVKLAELAGEILPPGVLNVITGHGKPAGSSLVTHDDIDMVSLTGSPATGKWIAGGGRHAQARPPRARRQGAGDRVRRRRRGDRARDDRGHRALQRGPGLHCGHPRARIEEGVRRPRRRPGRGGQGL
jgi:acyl-CoA reductase-like NAD-dependent aldehyde dehydrogenase